MIIPGILYNKGVSIDTDDILYIAAKKNEISIHTIHGIVRPLVSLQDYEDYFQNYGFEMLSKSHLVQMAKIKHYNKGFHTVTFDSELPARGCYVSRRNRFKVKNIPE